MTTNVSTRINPTQPIKAASDELAKLSAPPSRWSGYSVKLAFAKVFSSTNWGQKVVQADSNARTNRAFLQTVARDMRAAGLADRSDMKETFKTLAQRQITLPHDHFKAKTHALVTQLPVRADNHFEFGLIVNEVTDAMSDQIATVSDANDLPSFNVDMLLGAKTKEMCLQFAQKENRSLGSLTMEDIANTAQAALKLVVEQQIAAKRAAPHL